MARRNILHRNKLESFKEYLVSIDICYDYAYFEVFGLTNEEFKELEKYYDSLEEKE